MRALPHLLRACAGTLAETHDSQWFRGFGPLSLQAWHSFLGSRNVVEGNVHQLQQQEPADDYFTVSCQSVATRLPVSSVH